MGVTGPTIHSPGSLPSSANTSPFADGRACGRCRSESGNSIHKRQHRCYVAGNLQSDSIRLPPLHQRPPPAQLLQQRLSIYFSKYSLSCASCINFGLALTCKNPSIYRLSLDYLWTHLDSSFASHHISAQLQSLNACLQQTQ